MLRLIGGTRVPIVLVPNVLVPILAAIFISTIAEPARATELLVEPGVPLGDGSWLLPVGLVDPAGRVVPPTPADLVIGGPEGSPLGFVPVPFAPATGGLASARIVLVDGPLPAADQLVRWQQVLVAELGGRGPDAPRRVQATAAQPHGDWGDGDKRATAEIAASEVAVSLGLPDNARLWDSVVDAMQMLAEQRGMVRRVLVVVSDGEEELVSEHVLASCVEAALRARIAVHVLVTAPGGDASAGVARMRVLARRTGGLTRLAEDDGPAALNRLLGDIDGVAGLRIEPAPGAALPAEVRVQLAAAAEVVVAGRVEAPRPLAAPGPWRWLLPAAGLGVVVAAGWWLWRRRSGTVGVLMVRTRKGMRRFPVPRAGVSLGTDPDNSLVLPSGKLARHHAVIRVRDGALHVTDLRSAGGTRVNGRPIRTQRLADGDRILLGGAVEMIYQERDA